MLTHEEKQSKLNNAGSCLSPVGVFLVNSDLYLFDEYSFGSQIEGARQSLKALLAIAMDEREDGKAVRYRFRYDLGVRYTDQDLDEDDEGFLKIEIAAEFEAHYLCDERLPDEEIELFAKLNVPYNIWPYWREYVQNICGRMGVPLINIPFQTEMQEAEIRNESKG